MTIVSALVIQAKDTGRFLLKKSKGETLWHFTGSFELDFVKDSPIFIILSEVEKDLGRPLGQLEAFLKTRKLDFFMHAWVENEIIHPKTDDEYIWVDLLHLPQDVDPSVDVAFSNKMFQYHIIQP